MENINMPLGVRRDGSFYTRVEWASVTESDPTFWVLNIINDDHERNGGTYGANHEQKADVVISFFGEVQKFQKIRIFKNVGLDISVPEELCRTMNIYVATDDSPRKLRRKDDNIEDVNWLLVKSIDMEKSFGWQEAELSSPVAAKYVRIEMVDNFCTRDENFIPWIETSEVKFYPGV